MKEQIEKVVSVLVGLPLHPPSRLADMMAFGFGKTVTEINRDGRPVDVPEYSLHVQCHWRLVGARPKPRIIAGRSDVFYPADPSVKPWDESFHWDVSGANVCDRRMKLFMEENVSPPLIVESIEADEIGSLRIRFSGGFVLELFPDSSFRDEQDEDWRLLLPGPVRPHFVVCSSRTEYLD